MRGSRVVVYLCLLCLAAVPCGPVAAQDRETELRRGFREIRLGATFEEVEEHLLADTAFVYRGRADVSLRLSDGQTIIDSRGRVFVDRGLFQFADGRLYTMALYINRDRLDYFQLFEQLRTRYGDPIDLDPQRALWEDETTRIELERPLTVRYLDLAVFEARRGDDRALEAAEDVAREQFIEEF
ncbi:MAG: hypothetical protein MI724_01655 [Spirochaetales bacterium]|nr:hypothetical protein [Spirochaetales bacterium]